MACLDVIENGKGGTEGVDGEISGSLFAVGEKSKPTQLGAASACFSGPHFRFGSAEPIEKHHKHPRGTRSDLTEHSRRILHRRERDGERPIRNRKKKVCRHSQKKRNEGKKLKQTTISVSLSLSKTRCARRSFIPPVCFLSPLRSRFQKKTVCAFLLYKDRMSSSESRRLRRAPMCTGVTPQQPPRTKKEEEEDELSPPPPLQLLLLFPLPPPPPLL